VVRTGQSRPPVRLPRRRRRARICR
jgi:hypothetical protein